MIKTSPRAWLTFLIFAAVAFGSSAPSFAQSSQVLDDDATRYMALGDSIAAGYKAMPVTDGYAYLLYQGGAFDRIPHTLFCNAAVPGATSGDVRFHQVPQSLIPFADGGFKPKYVTLTVGGNDLLKIERFAFTNPSQAALLQFATAVLNEYGVNLGTILYELRTGLPDAKIFVANQYTIPEIDAIVPLASVIVRAFNGVVNQVVSRFPSNVYVVDVYSAFLGQNNLLLIERQGASPVETHPTSVGHRVMAKAFEDAIDQNR